MLVADSVVQEAQTIESRGEGEIKVTVLILVKNPGSVFKSVLKMVLDQKVPFAYEVLVIDSGSQDGTLEFVREHSAVRLEQISPTEFGHGKTRNFGISIARGEYVAMLTHDAQPSSPNWLSSLVDCAERDSSIAGVFGRHIAYPNHGVLIKRDLEAHFSGFESEPVVWLEDIERYKVDAGYRQFLHFFSDNNAVIRKSVWESIPYPDVEFAEDQIWAQRLIEAGYKKAYAPEAIVFHSHLYGVIETLQRSFDESRALNKLFGYKLSKGLFSCLLQCLRVSKRDIRYSLEHGNHLDAGDRVRIIAKVLAKQIGLWLGVHYKILPSYIQHSLSKDRKLFRQ